MSEAWDGLELPAGVDLLEIARTTLLRDVVPGLQGDARFKALMVANALAIATREALLAAERRGLAESIALLGDLIHGDMWALCREIRAGGHDPGSDSYDAVGAVLADIAEARCRISAPRALAAAAGPKPNG